MATRAAPARAMCCANTSWPPPPPALSTPTQLYAEVTTAGPYAALTRPEFDACLDFAATGGYALRAYDRWQRLMQTDGKWHLRDPRAAAVIRQNLGTIIDTETLKVRLKSRWLRHPLGRGRRSLRLHPHPRRYLPDRRPDRAL